jgi:aarF domain-containing kinase
VFDNKQYDERRSVSNGIIIITRGKNVEVVREIYCAVQRRIPMNSWIKVAQGARLVASAVAKQTAEEATVVSRRVAHHGFDLSSRARKTVASMNGLTGSSSQMHAVEQTDSSQPSPISNSSGPSPYESQLRKKLEKAEEKNTINGDTQMGISSLNDASAVSQSSLNDTSTKDSMPNPFLLHAEPPISSGGGPSQRTSESESESGGTQQEINSRPSVEESTQESNLMDSSTTQIRASPSHETGVIGDESPSRMQEGRAVPSSRVGRAAGFASLGFGLAWGTVSEVASRLVGSGTSGNPISSDANADRLAATLCRMRGAALKMGQMLSIQDESLLPPALTRALNQVRQGADAMPNYQLAQQMESQLGKDWRQKFESFDDLPFAAASIGQVHRATIRNEDGSIRQVVVKVQYPGVANSIESDLRNLTMLVKLSGMAPKGLFLENVIRVGRDELKVECNYLNELANQQSFQELVASDPILQENNVVVPGVVEELTTEQVIVSDYCPGGTIDKVKHLDQEERNRIGRSIMYLTMRELFVWRLMQTDPNWGNFLYDVGSRQTTLIDFGATREFPKEFVDGYLRIVWANANRDEETLMEQSRKMGFLTGEENDLMLNAHKLSGFTVGEPFATDEPFDFQGSRISSRMSEHTSVFLQHRLTPPPEEVYTLHRKLAGAYMLCIKLDAVVRCRDMLEDVVREHTFDDGLPHPISG